MSRSIPSRFALLVLGVGLALALPLASASSESVQGILEFQRVTLSGTTTLSGLTLPALYFEPAAEAPLEQVWQLSAAGLVVNETSKVYKGVGEVPTNPNSSVASQNTDSAQTRSDPFEGASIRIEVQAADARVLLVPSVDGFATANAVSQGEVEVAPSQATTWRIGETTNALALDPKARFVSYDHPIAAGQPLFRLEGSASLAGQGDFHLYVWGATVRVEDAQGNAHEYWSGQRDDNSMAVAGHRAARDEEVRLLDLQVRNGSFTAEQEDGSVQGVAEQATVETSGIAEWKNAAGTLRSSSVEYSAQQGPLRVKGQVLQSVRPSIGSAPALESAVRADDAQVFFASASSIETAGVAPRAALASPGSWALAAAAALAVLVVAYVRLVYPRTRRGWARLMEGAQLALEQERPLDAMRRARRLVRIRRDSEEAWFVYGGGLVRTNQHQAVIDRVEPVAKRLEDAPILAFLLALSYVNLGKIAEAARWARKAASIPELAAQLRKHPALSATFDPKATRRAADAASGYA